MKTLNNCTLYLTNENVIIQHDNQLYLLKGNELIDIKTPMNDINNIIITNDSKIISWGFDNSTNTLYIGDTNNNWKNYQLGDNKNIIKFITCDNLNRSYIKIQKDDIFTYKIYYEGNFYNIHPYYHDREALIEIDDNYLYLHQINLAEIKKNNTETTNCQLHIKFKLKLTDIKLSKDIIPNYDIHEVSIYPQDNNIMAFTVTGQEFENIIKNGLENNIPKKIRLSAPYIENEQKTINTYHTAQPPITQIFDSQTGVSANARIEGIEEFVNDTNIIQQQKALMHAKRLEAEQKRQSIIIDPNNRADLGSQIADALKHR